jgi:hypothetical protein
MITQTQPDRKSFRWWCGVIFLGPLFVLWAIIEFVEDPFRFTKCIIRLIKGMLEERERLGHKPAEDWPAPPPLFTPWDGPPPPLRITVAAGMLFCFVAWPVLLVLAVDSLETNVGLAMVFGAGVPLALAGFCILGNWYCTLLNG